MSKLNFKDFYSNTEELHTTKIDVVFDPSVVKYSRLQCNDDRIMFTNMPEVARIEEFVSNKPETILEIGGGIGRASVYFRNRFNWDNTKFYMLDGNSGEKQIAPIDGDGTNDFYNNFDATIKFCLDNNITNIELMDASNLNWKDQIKDVKFNLIYSFLSIGFHWNIDMYLDHLYEYCNDNTVLLFGMRGTDRGDDFALKQEKIVNEHPKYQIVKTIRESELYRTSVLVLKVI